jgi:hypothetical protein
VLDRAEALANGVVEAVESLDARPRGLGELAAEPHGGVERNILRLGIFELRQAEVPPKVAIDEAVRLAHWFGGSRAPGFVNGVLDGIAHAPGTAVRSRSRRMNILAVNWQDLETRTRREPRSTCSRSSRRLAAAGIGCG